LSLIDRKRAYCALDFGTTYSTIGYYEPGFGPRLIPSPQGKILVPSIVSFSPNFDYVVGWDALERARASPLATLFHVKRFLGSNKIYNVLGRSLRPEGISGLIISHLRQNAEDYFGREISEAVVSAPANFTIAQSNALLRACEIAQVNVSRIIAEPCAAAIIAKELFQKAQREDGHMIVLDLGGGTFDVALLEYGQGVIEIKAVVGDNLLGGLDFDEALFSYVLKQLLRRGDVDDASVLAVADLERLKYECERAKIALGGRHETAVIVQNIEIPNRGSVDFDVLITREDFREATQDLNARIKKLILLCLKRARVSPGDLCSVVLAGQGCKIFTIGELLENLFLTVPIVTRFQEFAVGYGLSKYAGVFAGDEKDLLLLDANYTTLELRCRSLEESEELDAVVSGEKANNPLRLVLIAEGKTLPTRYHFRISVTDLKDNLISLDVVERGNSGSGEEVLVAQLPVEAAKKDIIDILVDCDASRTFLVSCRVPSKKRVHVFQLNNPYYRRTSGPVNLKDLRSGRRFDTRGYEVLPIVRVFDMEDGDASR
jgi:molecular chaperone DnaK (HSP70)